MPPYQPGYTLVYMPPYLPGYTSHIASLGGYTSLYTPLYTLGGYTSLYTPCTPCLPGYTLPYTWPAPCMPLVEYTLLAASARPAGALGSNLRLIRKARPLCA